MHVNVRCPRCDKTLKAARQMLGRRVRCSKCGHEFELTAEPEAPVPLLTDEGPALVPRGDADNTLSRSMLPVMTTTPAAPADEMLARLEPVTLRWLNASAAVQTLLGETLEGLRKRSFTEFLHPDDRALAEDEFRKAIELGERHDFVLRLPDAAGLTRYVRVYSQARYNPDGAINHVRCYLKDVTERVQAEQELRRRTEQLTDANEQLRQINLKLKEAQSRLVQTEKIASLGTLAAGMAHEINNPLAYATNNVAVLGREVGDLLRLVALYQEGIDDLRLARPALADQIDALRAESDLPYLLEHLPRMTLATLEGLQRVAKIVENLRGFAQLDRAEVAMIDLNTALDFSLGMLADAMSRKQVKVQKHYEPLPELECAPAPLNQVFMNLLMNALQAIEAAGRGSGRVRVTTRSADGEIVVEVSDDGCGIPPDVLPKVFDPFFTTKPVGRGTGLGLSISHGIVADHGGRIEVQSAVGVGTRFLVHLPILRQPHP